MDSLTQTMRQAINQLLQDYLDFWKNDPEVTSELVLDTALDRYLLIEMGWQNNRGIYGVLIHIDIIDQKLWIQQDGTEEGVLGANGHSPLLVNLGIPKARIVLGYKSLERGNITEFAVF